MVPFPVVEEEDVTLTIEEDDSDGDNGTRTSRKRAKLIRERTAGQLQQRKLKIGYHHGHWNPLPSSWVYPKGMTVIQLCYLWLLENNKESVPPLRTLKPMLMLVKHFDKHATQYSKMKRVMGEVEKMGRLDHVWEDKWLPETVNRLWSTVWPSLNIYLQGKGKFDKKKVGRVKFVM